TERGIALELEPERGQAVAQLRADLAAAEARHGRSAPQLLVPLLRLARSGELRDAQRIAHLRRALEIASAARVPSSYLAMIAGRTIAAQDEAGGGNGADAGDYRRMIAHPAVTADPVAGALLRFTLASLHYREREWPEATAVAAQARALVGPTHPLNLALLDLTAAIESARGNRAAAAAALAAITSGSPRCRISVTRLPVSISSADFPRSAMEWGFEGYVTVESLVDGEGRATHRTILAYPPFVFNRGGEGIAARMRFVPAVEVDGRPCAVARQGIAFRIEQ
ncbi:MAG TPA: hypothetical protein VGB08_10420, partial [Allosphingosinicella sp.]